MTPDRCFRETVMHLTTSVDSCKYTDVDRKPARTHNVQVENRTSIVTYLVMEEPWSFSQIVTAWNTIFCWKDDKLRDPTCCLNMLQYPTWSDYIFTICIIKKKNVYELFCCYCQIPTQLCYYVVHNKFHQIWYCDNSIPCWITFFVWGHFEWILTRFQVFWACNSNHRVLSEKLLNGYFVKLQLKSFSRASQSVLLKTKIGERFVFTSLSQVTWELIHGSVLFIQRNNYIH